MSDGFHSNSDKAFLLSKVSGFTILSWRDVFIGKDFGNLSPKDKYILGCLRVF